MIHNLYHPFLSLHRFRHWVAVASAGMANNKVWVVASAVEAIGGVWLHFLFLFKLQRKLRAVPKIIITTYFHRHSMKQFTMMRINLQTGSANICIVLPSFNSPQ